MRRALVAAQELANLTLNLSKCYVVPYAQWSEQLAEAVPRRVVPDGRLTVLHAFEKGGEVAQQLVLSCILWKTIGICMYV